MLQTAFFRISALGNDSVELFLQKFPFITADEIWVSTSSTPDMVSLWGIR